MNILYVNSLEANNKELAQQLALAESRERLAQDEINRVKEVDFMRKVEAVAAGWKTKLAAQKEHSKGQFEELLRWVDDYCEVSDEDFEQIEPTVQSVLGEELEETPLADLRHQLAAAIAACKLKDEALTMIALDDCCTDPAPIAQKALAIQPDDSALKAWLGEPAMKVARNEAGQIFAIGKSGEAFDLYSALGKEFYEAPK